MGLAAGIVVKKDPSATMIVMPADHVIEPAEAFLATVRAAVAVIDEDPTALDHLWHQADAPRDRLWLHRARTAFGNTRRHSGQSRHSVSRKARPRDGRAVPGRRQLCVELGDLRLASANHSGRDTHSQARSSPRGSSRSCEPIGTPAEADTLARLFPGLVRVPIDKAVMEHARNVRVLEVPYRWSDVGDWRAVASLLKHDAAGNAIQGNVVARDSTGSILISDDGGLVAVLGVEDLVVVHSGNATLVARKDQLDKLKGLVEGLGEAGFGSYL